MRNLFRFQQPKQKIGLVSKERRDVLEQLQDFLNQELFESTGILVDFWQNQQDAISNQEIKEIIINKDLNEEMFSFWIQDYSNLISNHISSWWKKAIETGADKQTFFSKAIKKGFSSNPGSNYILNYINNHGGELITNISNEQREAIKGLLTNSVMNEHSADELAKAIRPCIGLNTKQATANLNYYDHVKESLTKAHPRMKPSSIELKAREAADKYAKKQLRYRAHMIAQTELARAYNYGAEMAAEQAFQDGYLGKFERIWCTSGDKNVCSECAILNGTKVEKGLIPPLHPLCCCAIQYVEIEKPRLESVNHPRLVEFLEVKNEELLSEELKGNLEKEIELIPPIHRSILESRVTSLQIINKGNSRFNRENGTIYLRNDFEKGEAIHEMAHIIEEILEVWSNTKFINLLRDTIGEIDYMADVIEDTETFVKTILRINNTDKFISIYQSRVYDEVSGVLDDFSFNYQSLGDFFSEAYKCYLINPALLKEKQILIYNFLEELK